MKAKILLFILLLGSYTSAYAYTDVVLFGYENNKLKNEIQNDKLKFFIIGQNARIINNTDSFQIILRIDDDLEPIIIPIGFDYKTIRRSFNYTYTPKYPNKLDIAGKMTFKRLQKRPLSCESAVTSDILSYMLGKNISEYDVSSRLSKQFLNKIPFLLEGLTFWGNPNVGFVGYMDFFGQNNDIKPTQRDMQGYGVYEKPIASVFDSFGFSTKIINKTDHTTEFTTNKHLTYLLKNFTKGNMVQLWGDWCTRDDFEDGSIDKYLISQEKVNKGIYAKNYCTSTMDDRYMEWYYIEDFQIKKHRGLVGEHAFYLLGYEGGVENPTHIIVWDSDTGYHRYATEEWMRKWGLMDYRSIIIYKK